MYSACCIGAALKPLSCDLMPYATAQMNTLLKIVLVGLLVLLVCSQTLAATPEKQPEAKQVSFMLILAVWLAVFALTLSAGYAIGKARSINFEDSDSDALFQKYISGKVTMSRTWELQRDTNGALVELKSVCTWRFARGIFAHVYDSKTQTHHVESAQPNEWTTRIRRATASASLRS
jgi:hypothetical protein